MKKEPKLHLDADPNCSLCKGTGSFVLVVNSDRLIGRCYKCLGPVTSAGVLESFDKT